MVRRAFDGSGYLLSGRARRPLGPHGGRSAATEIV